jgi:stress response protein YsnF
MAQEMFVALFHTIGEAESAKRDLEGVGFPSSSVSARSHSEPEPQDRGFWGWLFGTEPDYKTHVDQGAAVLTITTDPEHYDRVADVLRNHDVIETDQSEIEGEQTTRPPAISAQSDETVIPTAREELKVGKREVEDTRRYRVRRYTVERPVEEQIELRAERVEIERRAPSATTRAGEQPFEEKIVEITERREEPVVSKDVKPGEDVVVRKSEEKRRETIRDTVRETKVDVDQAAAGNKPPQNG